VVGVQVGSLSQADVLRVGLLVGGALAIHIVFHAGSASTAQRLLGVGMRVRVGLVWAHCWVLRERACAGRVSGVSSQGAP
jgi:hypothetical protein